MLANLDLIKVSEALRSVEGLAEWDIDSVSAKLSHAATTFLAADLRSSDLAVELEFTEPEGHGIMDLVKVDRHSASCSIVDWKSGESVDKPNFTTMLKESWQTLMYLGLGGEWLRRERGLELRYIEYRCIGDPETLDHVPPTKVVQVQWAPWYLAKARQQLAQVERTMLTLSPLEPWPQNKPWQCHKGSRSGASCPYWLDCTSPEGYVLPAETIERLKTVGWTAPVSKSSVGTMLECPELYRRTKVLGDPRGDSTHAQRLGNSFHAGAQVLWGLAWEKRKEFL